MATIARLKLEIKKGSSESQVTVSYDLCFMHCERLAGSVFIENVKLMGDDWLNDDNLYTLSHHTCIKAPSSKVCIPRKFTKTLKNSVLDEDDSFFNRKDEVYARVTITPFVPSSKKADSNIISSYF